MIAKSFRNLYKFSSQDKKKFAIVLHGNGVYDGTETTEAVSLMIALSKLKADYQCYAPNKNQFHVVNHLNGEEQSQTRNILEESARIARGNVKDLALLKANDYDGIIIPGGFGAAKNLSDFAVKGANYVVDSLIEQQIFDFYEHNKIIAACCISPILLARVLGKKGIFITLGSEGKKWPYSDAIGAAQQQGAKTVDRQVDQVCIDGNHRIYTTPAYMYEGNPYEVYTGIENMVKKIIEDFYD
ncbi:hypothetical protein PPERSA_10495 [Pseudocohnilembus persalinus]|uniref:DJ-1/PfpI domain-containing protein n=1 Tax=Pseudocohnilembus persalinus TaxID=266149 RepID=A0A0V0R7D9_PSEPJ|nr:hypothetical protein PPERSA_10495 [Pseudocohnilembus persalinus]|eukprot:KRX10396.1 hypothetical protein PPERSA_10495 [Pseudocohnilembus persalinus]